MSGIYDDKSFFCDYAKMERSQGLEHSGEWYQLEPLFPALKGLSVLDLGCGYGWHCDYAARQGASRVLGIDESSLMLSEARRRFERPPVAFRQLPILDYEYPEGEWDLVFSNLALHYIEDLAAAFQKVHRTLTRGGVFLFNIEHPVFTAGVRQEFRSDEEGLYWPVRGYFSEGARTTSFLGHSVTKYHHSLSSIVDSLLDAGFSLERLVEARPSAEALRADERLRCELERPIMLIIRCRRT